MARYTGGSRQDFARTSTCLFATPHGTVVDEAAWSNGRIWVDIDSYCECACSVIIRNTNLRSTLEKIIKRAGVQQWPKLWQNLRDKRFD